MTWSETSKNRGRWRGKRSTRGKVYRHSTDPFNTRGAIAEEIHGELGDKVTRKDLKDRFGVKTPNKLSEVSKGSSEWEETS